MRRALCWLLILLPVVALLALWAWFCEGVVRSEPIVIEQQELELPQWPADGRSYRAVVVADLHLARWQGGKLADIVQRIRALRPDIILSLGDIPYGVDNALSLPAEEVKRQLAPLVRDFPMYYVSGNHDFCPQRTCLSDIGAVCCDNKTQTHAFDPEHQLAVVGYVGAHGQPLTAPAEDGAPHLAISHYPISFYRCATPRLDAVIAAHTHGGQLCTPSGMPLFAAAGLSREQLRGGFHRTADDRPLYITRGIGCSKVPFRLYCPSELTLFTLRGPTP